MKRFKWYDGPLSIVFAPFIIAILWCVKTSNDRWIRKTWRKYEDS